MAVGCTVEDDDPMTAERLGSWHLASGMQHEVTLHPFDELETQYFPTPASWTWTASTTLPSAEPPKTSLDYQTCWLEFAWTDADGLSVRESP